MNQKTKENRNKCNLLGETPAVSEPRGCWAFIKSAYRWFFLGSTTADSSDLLMTQRCSSRNPVERGDDYCQGGREFSFLPFAYILFFIQ